MAIKNIIIDLGGVIINLDHSRLADAFKKLGVRDFDKRYAQNAQQKTFDDFERGALTAEEFRNVFRKYIVNKVTDQQIDEAWNQILMDVPETTMDLLKKLSKDYRLFLLSNTNVIHIPVFTKIIESAHGKGAFEKVFEKIYYSCNMKMRKPDPEIFETVIRENKLLLTETIFIDDGPQHIEGARAVGLTAFLLEKNQTLENLVTRILEK